jgi:SWI/SNF-related matrix-associated actin-dependent regulator of chromatin subfamily A member 5
LAEKETLAEEGFPDWKRNHFLAFIKSLERYGRDALDKVAQDVADHTEEEVREYARVFFERHHELKGE